MARGRGPRHPRGGRARGGAEEPEEYDDRPVLNMQQSNVGMMPSSDSESESESEDERPRDRKAKAKGKAKPAGQNPNVGELPPSSSDEEESSEEESSSEEEPAPASPPRARRAKDERDPAEIAADLERLRLVRERRAKEREERIKSEGFDRYAPPTEDNRRA